MQAYEIGLVASAVRTAGGAWKPDARWMWAIPEDAQLAMDPILAPYDRTADWFFDSLAQQGQPPWAFACLDREYPIAGHVASARTPEASISFTPYSRVPAPLPPDYVPAVGALALASKAGLGLAAERSPLFARAFEGLLSCSEDRHWMCLLDPLPETWLATVLPGDRERWLRSR